MTIVEVHQMNGRRVESVEFEFYHDSLETYKELYLKYGKTHIISWVTERGANIQFPRE